MEELDKGLDIAMKGPGAEAALAACRAQIGAWDVALPEITPLVLDFGLGEFEKVGLVEFWLANELKAGYCGKYLFVFDGQTCPKHRHRTKKETFFIVKGTMTVALEDGELVMQEGDVLPIEPWTYHSFTGVGPCLMLELSMPCEVDDNFFEDRRIPIGGNYMG